MVDALNNLSEENPEFTEFCVYLKKASGITISPGKSYLVSARIRQIMVDYDFKTLADLLLQLKCHNRGLQQKVVDAMTTNETFWFRDNYPFDFFSNTLLPTWNADKHYEHKPIRIWSAACSSGQEPYSLAMLIEEYKEKNRFTKRVEIIATDLSSQILENAKLGEYDHLSMGRGLSKNRLNKFFSTSCEKRWAVAPAVRKNIRFQPINLLESYANLGKFDIIFCRNVLIYFTKETRSAMLTRMHQALNPGGYICLGSSEGLGDRSSLFTMINCQPGLIYQAK
ncbi:MAG: chemotaxis protein methyltransferase CheR [Cellvibrionaceae bacterium]|jgi:chemotaxis protein methyltransferase CheR